MHIKLHKISWSYRFASYTGLVKECPSVNFYVTGMFELSLSETGRN